jgi:3-dehydroquinate dehydratase/shikimate dehydrogenase
MLPAYYAMAATRAPRLKLVPRALFPSQGAAVRELLAQAGRDGRALASFALGEAGTATRVLALAWGSWATYGSAADDAPTAEGQLPARALLEVFRAPVLHAGTLLHGLVGTPLHTSPSPAMHQAGYRALGLDACYLPFATGDPAEVAAAAAAYGLRGFGVDPLKQERRCCRSGTPGRAAAGAVNTVVVGRRGRTGYNRTGRGRGLPGERTTPRTGTPRGAGGTAAGVGAALRAAGAAVTLCARTAARAEELARRIGADVLSWSARAAADWDVLVQATPLGRQGEEVLPASALRGHAVLDAAYGAATTPLVAAARARGLAVFTGTDLLVAQGELQFARLTGREVAVDVLRQAAGAA